MASDSNFSPYDGGGTDLRERGHVLTFDQNGTRTSDTFVGTKIVADSQLPVVGYDGMGRLKSVEHRHWPV